LVLVCDDDPCIINIVGEMLARQAYGLIAADSGQQALALAARIIRT